MKFTNAYELFKTLFDRDALKGFSIKQVFMFFGNTPEFEIDSTIEELGFNKLAEEIFDDWCKHSEKANMYPSDYACKLYLNDKDNLSISIEVTHDLCEYHGDENIIDDILQISIRELSLEKLIDEDEDLALQFDLSFNLEVKDMFSGKYDFSLFQIRSSHGETNEATKIDNLINSHIESFGLLNLQKIIFEYFVKLQNGNVDYHGIHLEIEKNELQTFQGFGADKDELFKDYLENYPLDFTIDLDQIENKI